MYTSFPKIIPYLKEKFIDINLDIPASGVQNELVLERQRLSQLQADFDYNLGLLSQRDDELAHYEKAFTELKRVINNLLAENSELKASNVYVCAWFPWY